MQAAPTIGSCFGNKREDVEKDLDDKLSVRENAEYCSGWVVNATSRSYYPMKLDLSFCHGFSKQVMNTFLVYLVHNIKSFLEGREKRPELFSIVLVWLGHVVQVISSSPVADKLKESCFEYVSFAIDALELGSATITRFSPGELTSFSDKIFSQTHTSEGVRTDFSEDAQKDIVALGNIELYLRKGEPNHLLHLYWKRIQEDRNFSQSLESHEHFAEVLKDVLNKIPDPEEDEEEETLEVKDSFQIGMELFMKASAFGIEL
eukprot:snap_masked-scaffold_116-processed-gene-0.2-mRNA-1 protein AED:1.00 eAED:1.00 QI:0/-1/0/0/-1/1/1/0/260